MRGEMRKRILSLLMCICICAAAGPANAAAEGNKTEEKERDIVRKAVSAAEETEPEIPIADDMDLEQAAAEREEKAELVDSGTWQGIDWSLDTDGYLILAGGEGASSDRNAPWLEYGNSIVSAKVTGSGWKNTRWMFASCKMLESVDVSELDTSGVTDMSGMFSGCSGLKRLDVSSFHTSNVTNMADMFNFCKEMTKIDVSDFDTGNVTDMSGMFGSCWDLERIDVSSFDTGNVTDMNGMFFSCSDLTYVNVSGFNTSNVTDMEGMFNSCRMLGNLDVSGFDTGRVTNMTDMFSNCTKLKNINVSGFNTGNVTSMQGMFSGCSGLKSIDVGGFETSNVTSMRSMFYDCASLINLDVSVFDTEKVEDMSFMFSGCRKLTYLDVSGFDTSNITQMRNMFTDCNRLSAEITVQNIVTDVINDLRGHEECFLNAATEPGSKIIVRYGGNCTKEAAEEIVATKSENSHVYLEGQEATAATVAFDRTELTLKKEEMADLIPAVAPVDAWEAYLWTSDNPSVAVVDEEGTVTGISEGQTVIKLAVGSASAECSVTVGSETAVRVTDIVLDKSRAALSIFGYPQETLQLTATVTPGDASYKKIVWSSSDTGVAWVDENGLVTPLGIGKCIITAATRDGNKTASCIVNVTTPKNEPLHPESGRVAGNTRYSTALECAGRMKEQAVLENGEEMFSAVVVASADNFPDALAGSPLAASFDAPILLVGKSASGTEETLAYIRDNVKKDGTIYLLGGSGAIPKGTAETLVSYGFGEERIKTLAGNSRYDTNLRIVEEMSAAKGTEIVIVSGKTYADSLSISGIAGAKGMPIFLAADFLSEEAVNKIKELAPEHIYIIGGPAAVSEDVFRQAENLCGEGSVTRIAGISRYATSLEVAKYFDMDTSYCAVIAYGGDFPDGLTGGAFAARINAPVLLVSNENYKEQAEFLENGVAWNTYIMGGTSVISDETMGYLMK